MRRRTLTLGIVLILLGVFVLREGAEVFAPVAELAGLSTRYTRENVILPPTLYSVPAENYTFATSDLPSDGQFVGSVQVAGGRQVGFYVMNEGNFSLWRAHQPASVVLAEPLAVSYNFTVSPTSSGTYYFLFDNRDSSPNTVIFSLSSLQEVISLNPIVQYSGFELLLLGALLSFFGLRGGKPKVASERVIDSGWKCRFCGAQNVTDDRAFCAKCGRAQD